MNEVGVNPDQETYINYVFPSFDSVRSVRGVLQVSTSKCGFNFIIEEISFLPNCLVVTPKEEKSLSLVLKTVIVCIQFSKSFVKTPVSVTSVVVKLKKLEKVKHQFSCVLKGNMSISRKM